MSDEDYEDKCICQLCECGNHRCPHSDALPGGEDGEKETEYGKNFMKKEAIRAKLVSPAKDNIKYEGPIADVTTHNEDFKPWEVTKRGNFKPKENFVATSDAFADDTTHLRDYTPKHAERMRTKKREERSAPADPFNEKSTHQTDFIERKTEKPKSYKPKTSYVQSTHPMEDVTVSHADYKPIAVSRQAAVRPVTIRHFVDSPFDATTEHRDNFPEKKVEKQRDFRPQNTYRPNSQPLQDSTTYTAGYVPINVPRASPVKPAQTRHEPNGAFDGITTMKADFVPKKNRICPAEFVLTRRKKTYQLRNEANGHRFYRRMKRSGDGDNRNSAMARIQ